MLTINDLITKIKLSKSVSSIIRMIKNNDYLLNLVESETSYLIDVNLNLNLNLKQRVFHLKNDLKDIPICTICNINGRIWDNKYSRYRNWCSDECKKEYMILNRDIEKEKQRIDKIKKTKLYKYGSETYNNREKSKKTCLKKYGVDSFSKTDLFNKKMIEKLGVISPFSIKEVRDKAKKTLYDNYKVDHNSKLQFVVDKRKETCIKKYGTKTPSENKEIRSKIIKTNIKKYGFRSPILNDDILKKSKGKYKNIEINGSIYRLQGYEDYVYSNILLKKYNINDIYLKTKDISEHTGEIIYKINGINHRYFPDFYIKSMNKIIEVKSKYTYEIDIEKNLKKMNKCLELGFLFEFIIVENVEYKKWKNNQ